MIAGHLGVEAAVCVVMLAGVCLADDDVDEADPVAVPVMEEPHRPDGAAGYRACV